MCFPCVCIAFKIRVLRLRCETAPAPRLRRFLLLLAFFTPTTRAHAHPHPQPDGSYQSLPEMEDVLAVLRAAGSHKILLQALEVCVCVCVWLNLYGTGVYIVKFGALGTCGLALLPLPTHVHLDLSFVQIRFGIRYFPNSCAYLPQSYVPTHCTAGDRHGQTAGGGLSTRLHTAGGAVGLGGRGWRGDNIKGRRCLDGAGPQHRALGPLGTGSIRCTPRQLFGD